MAKKARGKDKVARKTRAGSQYGAWRYKTEGVSYEERLENRGKISCVLGVGIRNASRYSSNDGYSVGLTQRQSAGSGAHFGFVEI